MTIPRLYKTEAIVLRQRKLGEADRILTLFTPVYGKLDAKAKGVRKTSSRMSGYLQPLNRCMVQLAQGRSLEVITGCETLESLQGLREQLESLSRALYAAELADRFVPERVESLGTYRLLLDTLRRLQRVSDGAAAAEWGHDLAVRYFELRLLDQSGFRPQLERCAGCDRGLEDASSFFSPVAGGAVCASCGTGAVASLPITEEGLKVLRTLQRASYNELAALPLPQAAQEVERHLRRYIVCVLERDVNAAAFIERLRREQPPSAKEPAAKR